MDLGYKDTLGIPSSPSGAGEKDKPKITYPELTIRNQPAKDQLADYECEPGEEYTATVRLRAVSVTKNDGNSLYDGTSVRYDVLSMDDFKHAEGKEEEPDDEDKAEEKALGYKRPKSVKEAPSTDAKELEE
jgi:hypothetical protein